MNPINEEALNRFRQTVYPEMVTKGTKPPEPNSQREAELFEQCGSVAAKNWASLPREGLTVPSPEDSSIGERDVDSWAGVLERPTAEYPEGSRGAILTAEITEAIHVEHGSVELMSADNPTPNWGFAFGFTDSDLWPPG